MITPVSIEPTSFGGLNLGDHRHRAVIGERPLLPDATSGAPASPDTGKDRKFAGERQPPQPQPEPPTEPSYDGVAARFAAAVIAGALPPVPTTMEELILRIGASPIPPDSEARLKDLLA